ncbi:MAG TPA: phage antirepressor Ant [Hungateiclostridium thermocellum]|uniref:Prophage antirepressor n=1 Tax=Acetivibrio thermocellus (strain ATCC 27405 / DSM 1237 / JCM 9322 / NBRC 103400 / NCIMB 10682 / NRRL B-4536 / VPI 7372) TaxID=203119 RepID=A3DI85_ACET2|nr:phage antirepressor [Acetivibrio thermocellus]ABN53664.1 prophage antirepressor [Acetivibrio thermocellus ATCC 27405]HBW27858.1 phage antirepressor Ant [Acetivibrio thermocellus]
MADLPQVFNYKGKQVRTFIIDGEPWWVAKDVCDILELGDTHKAMERLDEDERNTIPVTDSLGRLQETYVVNEAGLYNLILGSRKQEAKEFKRWITHEVIPQIRKTGIYALEPKQLLAVAIIEAQKIIEEQDRKIKELQPKAEFFDAVAGSKDAIDMNRAAKLIYEETRLGRNKLFKLLRDKGILMKDNIPYQEYIDKGYFRTIEQKYTKPDGTTHIYIKTLVYQKGLDFIRKIVKEDNVIHLKRAKGV